MVKIPDQEIKGQNIVNISCLGSKYDQGCWLNVTDDKGEVFRINVNEFLKVINDLTFNAHKKRVYRHLEIIKINKEVLNHE